MQQTFQRWKIYSFQEEAK